ncbi:hypothetical protein, partial [Fulvivirga kasyanovii]|uniref:hypothetical protein n=1 Tax=Fulvivirga kasyanovii TaxID=396812 RepID=UPI001C86CE9B
ILQEYYDHLNAYDNQNYIEVTVSDVNCGRRSNIRTKYLDETHYVRLASDICKKISIGDKVKLLKGKSGRLYWYYKPTNRIFWLIPMCLILAGFILYWG